MVVFGQFALFCLVLLMQTGLALMVYVPVWLLTLPRGERPTLGSYFTWRRFWTSSIAAWLADLILWNYHL